MLQRRRSNSVGRKRALVSFLIIIFIFFLIIQGLILIEKRLRPNILSLAEVKANNIAVEAVNKAIIEKVAGDVSYQDLILIEKDNEGKIVLAQLNTAEANRILSETTLTAVNLLDDIEKSSFDIPLGEASGSYLLASYGPRIPVRMISAGKVTSKLHDNFEAAGINQVRHKIYLQINTDMRIIVPFISSAINVDITVPIADAIYPGEVPDTVINIEFPP